MRTSTSFSLDKYRFFLAHLSSPVTRFRPESVRARKTRLDKIRTSEQNLVKLSSCLYVCRLKAFPSLFLNKSPPILRSVSVKNFTPIIPLELIWRTPPFIRFDDTTDWVMKSNAKFQDQQAIAYFTEKEAFRGIKKRVAEKDLLRMCRAFVYCSTRKVSLIRLLS